MIVFVIDGYFDVFFFIVVVVCWYVDGYGDVCVLVLCEFVFDLNLRFGYWQCMMFEFDFVEVKCVFQEVDIIVIVMFLWWGLVFVLFKGFFDCVLLLQQEY